MKTKVKETFKDQERVEVDGKTSAIPIKLDFNTNNGTGKITLSITSKQISPKDVYKQGVLEMCEQMLSSAYDHLLELMQQYADDNPIGDPNQKSLDEAIEEQKGSRAREK